MGEEFTFSELKKCDVCGYEDKTARILDRDICSDCHACWESFSSDDIDLSDCQV
jgi:hypothetical protein